MRNRLVLATLTVALLAACNRGDPAPQPPGAVAGPAPQTALGRQIDGAMRKARQELHTENINLNEGLSIGTQAHRRNTGGVPKGEITPAGDFLIEGKAVPLDATQRALMLEYRGHVLAIADAGMALGVKGADLGMQAAGEAIRGIFTGNPEEIEKRIEAQAAGMEAEAARLCDRLPAMRATQERLAAALPAFKPYARMDQSDIDNCVVNRRDGSTRDQVREQVRAEIRGGVRDAVRGAAQTAAGVELPERGNAAEQAEADSTTR